MLNAINRFSPLRILPFRTRRAASVGAKTVPPELGGLPEVLFNNGDKDDCEFVDFQGGDDETPFIQWSMLDHLRDQPYHKVTVEGRLDLKKLANDHRSLLFRSETCLNHRGKPCLARLLFNLAEGVYGYYDRPTFALYAPTPEAAAAAALQFRRYVIPPAPPKLGFYLLCIDGRPGTEFVPVQRWVTLAPDALALHYGEDFIDWEKDWTERLNRQANGVSVLFGPPGCGKTTYLRALMAKLIDRCVFYYLPISEFEVLSSPHFVGFWLSESRRHANAQKIVILEDAEELLLPRDGGNRDKVSNLLNIGDGFLGDHLKLHVIATTNVPMQGLDPAVTRPGQPRESPGCPNRRITRWRRFTAAPRSPPGSRRPAALASRNRQLVPSALTPC
jgi:hypothetical protein